MKCISGAKIPPFGEAPVYYNPVSQDVITDIQTVISTNTKKLMLVIYDYLDSFLKKTILFCGLLEVIIWIHNILNYI